MRNCLKTILSFFLTLILVRGSAQNNKLTLVLQVSNTVNKLPLEEDDWFAVHFICIVKNISSDTVYFVDPQAYKIFPHPWSIAINGIKAEFWPGSIMCAPPFTKEDIIKLAPGDTISKAFEWHTFVLNFTTKPGIYKAKVRYLCFPQKTGTMGADTKQLSLIETFYSNEVSFKIEK